MFYSGGPPPPPSPAAGAALPHFSSAASQRKSGRRDEADVATTTVQVPVMPETVWRGWGASLPPRGYTASQRHLVIDGDQPADEPPPSPSPPPLASAHEWKRRRTEHVSFVSLLKEVFMYLDAAATQQQEQQQQQSGRGGEAWQDEEDVAHRPLQIGALPAHALATVDGNGRHPSSSAPLTSVDAAVGDTMRVLRQCWEYCGAPHDAFEPVRLLSPVTMHLLLTYGHHTITPDGHYVMLRGGAEQLPWVGCLYGILLAFRSRHRHPTAHAGTQADAAAAMGGISRLLLLNCHSFGWLDHVGSDEYERSHRRLYQAREALVGLLEDPRYSALGRPARCPLCASAAAGGDASTVVLLGDTIVMDGGAPSLGLASPRTTFTAHYQYGRGIACCVPERGSGSRGGALPPHAGRGAAPHTPAVDLCAAHREPHTPHTPSGSYDGCHVECTAPPRVLSGGGGGAAAVLDRLPVVCCGVCRSAGVLGQALLLGPTGPLVIHLQIDEREWAGVGARAAPSLAGHGWLAAPVTDTPAVCPPPPSSSAACLGPSDSAAAAVAASLYAILLGEGPAAVPPQHCRDHQHHHHHLMTASAAPPCGSPPLAGGVPLAELAEWLVRLLRTPPPALVVEWHATAASAPTDALGHIHGGCADHAGLTCEDGRPSPPSRSWVATATHAVTPTAATGSPHWVSACPVASGTPTSAAAAMGDCRGTARHPHDRRDGAPPTSDSSACVPPAAAAAVAPPVSLGMSTQPRHSFTLQLLETYADVVQSRAAAAAAAVPPSAGNRGGASAAHVLRGRLLAVQEALRPCAATYLFDGVERPLVLAKDVEVAAEAERYLGVHSVATSLQFRCCPPHSLGRRD
ncbi:hypothetical protein NESM_000664500 [Novymonas esmeraldas]|uniref:Uncharacterized protein n=1 Tax=Novymonas esmeraldas TaxID=1808958 RepID=A0AAW0EUC0_9TRYP